MSFRSSEGAQWRDAEAAKAKKAAFLVLQANGRYTVSTTGPADAYFGSAGGGRVKIDASATEHRPNVRLVKVGDRFRAFGDAVSPVLLGVTPGTLSTASQTFTRASAAYQTSSAGLLSSLAADAVRSTHYIGGERTILLEAQRTNLLTYSEQFDNAAWLKSVASVSANAATAPDGAVTADKLIPNSGAGLASGTAGSVTQATTVSGGATWALSIYAEAAGFPGIQLREGAVTGTEAYVDLTTGAVTYRVGTSAGMNVTATDAGSGRWRVQATRTTDGGETSCTVNIKPAGGSDTGDGTSGVYLWGAMLEQASLASSYIKTEGATASRAVDALSLTGTWASQTTSRYLRYYDLAMAAFTDAIDVATRTGPDAVTVGRAYTHIYYIEGSNTLAEARAEAGVA